jgi:hypothetical protein
MVDICQKESFYEEIVVKNIVTVGLVMETVLKDLLKFRDKLKRNFNIMDHVFVTKYLYRYA